MLRKSPLPTFVLCGDNDYLDCKDSDKAWDRYLDTFRDFDKEWEDRAAILGKQAGCGSLGREKRRGQCRRCQATRNVCL